MLLMVKINIDIPDKLNKKLKIYRLEEDYKNKDELIVNILNEFFELND